MGNKSAKLHGNIFLEKPEKYFLDNSALEISLYFHFKPLIARVICGGNLTVNKKNMTIYWQKYSL